MATIDCKVGYNCIDYTLCEEKKTCFRQWWINLELAGVPPASFMEEVKETDFQIGDIVEKYTGDYQLLGEVRGYFRTKAGNLKYVVEHEPGFVHIYNGNQLRAKP